jgi:hypothetical protein
MHLEIERRLVSVVVDQIPPTQEQLDEAHRIMRQVQGDMVYALMKWGRVPDLKLVRQYREVMKE